MNPTAHPNKSTIRRKPRYTYKSPSAEDWNPATPYTSPLFHPDVARRVSPSKISTMSNTSPSHVSRPVRRRRNRMVLGLPLYHPMGSLALSLPPLDPTVLGLPSPATSDDNHGAHGSSRVRSSVTDEKLTVGTIAAVAAQEVTEKASSRKRRSGGGSKRKRKDMDDGDASYPTRRTRLPRSAIHQAASEEPVEETAAIGAEIGDDIFDDRKPERRSTRSRGNPTRRDSSFSDGGSGNMSLGAPNPPPSLPATTTDAPASVEEKEKTPAAVHLSQKIGDHAVLDEKEEGELSEANE